MDRSEKIYLIERAAKGAPEALEFWITAFVETIKFQCGSARIPIDSELMAAVRLAVWKAASNYKFNERTGWGNTWTSYLNRAITNAIMDVGAARGRRKDSPTDTVPEQVSPERPADSPGFILSLQWQEYAQEVSDLECEAYAQIRRREASGQLFEQYDGQYAAPYWCLVNDGLLLIRYFEQGESPSWPRFVKEHRLTKQGAKMLMFHLAQALDTVPSHVP